jgi:hypothetical protein
MKVRGGVGELGDRVDAEPCGNAANGGTETVSVARKNGVGAWGW